MQRLTKIDDGSGRVGDFFIVSSSGSVAFLGCTECNRSVHLHLLACRLAYHVQGMKERGGCTSRLMQESSRCTRHHAPGIQSKASEYALYMISACMQACMHVHSECAYMYAGVHA